MKKYPVYLRIFPEDHRPPRFVIVGAGIFATLALAKMTANIIADAAIAFAPAVIGFADRIEAGIKHLF